MKKVTIIVLCALCAINTWGQSTDFPSLPEIMTPSPKATMIDRFGYYPTNLYTGLVDITIPIYTINSRGLTVPIEFKYHASGLKFDDLPMELGYGWTLIAGGTVTYNARGTSYRTEQNADRMDHFIKETTQIEKFRPLVVVHDQRQLDYVIEGNKYSHLIQKKFSDSEYDLYNFSFPGHSGQCYKMGPNPGPAIDDFTTPSNLLTLTGDRYSPSAIDEHGNLYVFGVREFEGGYSDRNSTHYLTQIVSADNSETVNFVYEQFPGAETNKLVQRPYINQQYVMRQKYHENGGFSLPMYQYSIEGEKYPFPKLFNTPVLTEINYKGGRVVFTYSTTEIRSLQKIQVYEGNSLIKTITLDKTNHAYLNAVNFNDGAGKHVYSYKMRYKGTKPAITSGIDYWGYHNGAPSTAGIPYVPNFRNVVGGYNISGMDRTPNESVMQQGMLEAITYPTKGYSVFTYEAHRYNNEVYGGLRIKEINNYDENDNLLEKKWYDYGSGRAVRLINPRDFCSESLLLETDYTGTRMVSKTYVYSYGTFPICSYFEQGSSVVYSSVTEYTGTSNTYETKTYYRFSDYVDSSDFYNQTMRGKQTEHPRRTYTWKLGKLLNKTIEDRTGKTLYSLSNTYEEVNRKDYLNLRVLPYVRIQASNGSIVPTLMEAMNGGGQDNDFRIETNGSLYDYYSYYTTSGEYLVKQSAEYKDGITKITRYKYNTLGQVSEETLVESDGSEITTQYKYASDYWENVVSGSVHDKMYRSNMHAPVLEKSVYKDGLLIDRITTEYRDWSGFIAPYQVKQLGYTAGPRITYGYDRHRTLTYVSKDDLEQTQYLWGYKGQRPIAELKNYVSSFNTLLGQDFVDRVAAADSPSTADMQAIEALRDNATMPNSRLTTLYYNVALKLSRIIEPDGNSTYYEYDNFGRLKTVKDRNQHVIETYQYDYKTTE